MWIPVGGWLGLTVDEFRFPLALPGLTGKDGVGVMAQWLRTWARFIQRTGILFPAPTWQLITIPGTLSLSSGLGTQHQHGTEVHI